MEKIKPSGFVDEKNNSSKRESIASGKKPINLGSTCYGPQHKEIIRFRMRDHNGVIIHEDSTQILTLP